MEFPEGGLVYDYRLEDAGISMPALDEEDEEDLKTRPVSCIYIPIKVAIFSGEMLVFSVKGKILSSNK